MCALCSKPQTLNPKRTGSQALALAAVAAASSPESSNCGSGRSSGGASTCGAWSPCSGEEDTLNTIARG